MAKTILVVDDEKDLREIMLDLLEEKGFACLAAGSALEGAALAMKCQENGGAIDLIISDLNMPGGTGLDLLKELRKKGVQAPFLFLSGDVIDSELRPYLSLGVIGYQLKPFKSADFVAKINKILS